MNRTLVLLVVALAASGSLAGCLNDDDAPAPQETANTSDETAPTGLVADNAAAKANATATGDFQKSLDDRVHFHDAWEGETEKVIFDGDIQSGAILPSNPFFLFNRQFSNGAVTFTLPEGSLILPETKEIVATVTFTASPTVSALRIMWKSAPEKSFNGENVSADLAPGASAVIPTTVSSNDIPHTTVTKWYFRLVPIGPGEQATAWNGTAHVTLTIKRDEVLLLSPPHPDLWKDNTTITLYEGTFPAKQTWIVFPAAGPLEAVAPSEGFGEIPIEEGRIVPPHTGKIHITLNWTNADTTTGATNPRPAIAYSPANTRSFRTPDEVTVAGTTLEAFITTTPQMVDSPYDVQTNWFFFTYLASDSPTSGMFGPFGQVAKFDGTISVKIVLLREDAVTG
ncbi:MAG TPA: hypothetical protein VNZ52_01150 [Candidatus Thermoplasmatota archaeon]|nr:hypothetical protein [Candidatus Thermoplasmatota archaeon]